MTFQESEPTFPPEVIESILRNEGGVLASIPSAAVQYLKGRLRIPGAPEIQDLKPEHSRAIIGVLSFSLEADKDWDGFVARVQDNEDFEQGANNPFFPKWFAKTDDRPNVWMSDIGGEVDGLNQQKINQLFYLWQRPYTTGPKFTPMLRQAPIADPMIMETIVEALTNFMPTLMTPLGNDTGDNAEFRWSSTLPMLGSLGYDSFRSLSRFIAQHTDEEFFQDIGTATDDEITKALESAAKLSGYPINMAHVDCHDMIQALERCKLNNAPRWLPSLVLIHIMKHVRYYQNLGGKKYLFAAYRGRFAFIEIPEGGHFIPLGFSTNARVLKSLQQTLQISGGSGKKRTVCELAVAGILNNIQPEQITKPIPAHLRPDLIIAPKVTMRPTVPNQNEKGRLWIDSGIAVHNVGQFDETTGNINARDAVKGELALSLAWPLSDYTPDDIEEWMYELPPKVIPVRPSQFIFGLIRNVNPLGFEKGLYHIYDGMVILDLIRHKLVGSQIGSMANKEFPAMWTLPMGSTMEECTNQGKTNFSRVTARILVPGIDTSTCSGTTSPPAQRSSASQIERHGTAFYDEFVMPKSADHFFCPSGFVSACTGGLINPGKAMENSEGFKLRHPIFLAAKTGPEVEDVINRSFMVFLNQLTPENKCSDEHLATIFSGIASTIARLSTLLWISQNDIVAKVRKLKPVFGNWRFNAHLAVIKMLAGDEYPEVEKYLEASWKQCAQQRSDVESTNLMSEMGYRDKFDPKWYWDNVKDEILDSMSAECKIKGPMRLLKAVRYLVEDGDARKFSIELSQKGTGEKGADAALSRALKDGPFKRGPFEMTRVKMYSEGRHEVNGVLVKKFML